MRPVLRALLIVVWSTAGWADDDCAAPAAPQYEGRTASEWASQLGSEDVKLRQKAAYALFKLGPHAKDAAAPLVKAIRDSDPYVRTTSSKALERVGAALPKSVAGELVAELLDERQEVRREAAALFWRLGPLAAEAVPGLTKALASDDEFVRGRVAWCLGNAGAAGKPALDALARAVADPVEDVRTGAANAIARIDPAAAFASESADVRLNALKVYGDSPTNKEWTNPVILAGVMKAIDDRNSEVRSWAVHALDTFAVFAGDTRPVEWIAVFRRVLETQRAAGPRAAAAAGLGRYKGHGPEVVPPLIEAAKSREPSVRSMVLLALGWLGPEAKSAVPLVLDALRDEDASIRAAAAQALSGLADTSDVVIDALAAATMDADPWVYRNAITSLGAVGKGSPRVAAVLTRYLLRPESDPYACGDAVRVLVLDGTEKEAIPGLSDAFEKDSEAPLSVAFALRGLDAPAANRALARLTSALSDGRDPQQVLAYLRLLGPKAAAATAAVVPFLSNDDARIRASAAVALGAFGPGAEDALPALEHLTHDSDANVAAASKQAIAEIRKADAPRK